MNKFLQRIFLIFKDYLYLTPNRVYSIFLFIIFIFFIDFLLTNFIYMYMFDFNFINFSNFSEINNYNKNDFLELYTKTETDAESKKVHVCKYDKNVNYRLFVLSCDLTCAATIGIILLIQKLING